MNVRPAILSILLAPALVLPALPASAAARQASGEQAAPRAVQQRPRALVRPSEALGLSSQPVSPRPSAEEAEVVREQLQNVLRRYSPNLGRILALDPFLMQNGSYLEPYPDLVAFLSQHPEVLRNSSYYLSEFRPDYYRPPDRETRALELWGGFLAGFAVFLAFIVLTSTLIWLVKTLVDYRRWSRLSRVQTEAHNKLLDRLTANEELLSYVSSPSGRRFLESAPIMLDSSASISSPLKRILLTVEIGALVISLGAGLYLARLGNVPPEVRQMMFTAAVLALALGLGFIAAATASFVISKRVGVLTPSASAHGPADVPPAA